MWPHPIGMMESLALSLSVSLELRSPGLPIERKDMLSTLTHTHTHTGEIEKYDLIWTVFFNVGMEYKLTHMQGPGQWICSWWLLHEQGQKQDQWWSCASLKLQRGEDEGVSTCYVKQSLQSRGALSVHSVDGDGLWKPTEVDTEWWDTWLETERRRMTEWMMSLTWGSEPLWPSEHRPPAAARYLQTAARTVNVQTL